MLRIVVCDRTQREGRVGLYGLVIANGDVEVWIGWLRRIVGAC